MTTQKIRTWRGWLAVWVGLAIAYFVAATLCNYAATYFVNASFVAYVPAGISLTASMLWGSRVWPGVFLGELCATMGWGQPAGTCFLMAIGNGFDAALAGWLLNDRIGRRLELDRVGDILRLLASEVFVLQPMETAIGIAGLALGGTIPHAHYLWIGSSWYAANLLGQLAIAPTVLSWLSWPRPAATRREYWELGALSVAALVVAASSGFRWGAHDWTLSVSLFFVLPLLAWASVHFVPSVTLTMGSAMALFALTLEIIHSGRSVNPEVSAGVFRVNTFMVISLGTALFLSANQGQRRRFEKEQSQLITELHEALRTVKQLQGIVTFCAWTGRVQWRNQWVSVETFLRERFGMNISHGISEEAYEKFLKEVPKTDKQTPKQQRKRSSWTG